MAQTTFSGPVTSTNGFVGNLVGAVTPIVADGAAQRVSRAIGQVMQVNATTEYALIDIMFE